MATQTHAKVREGVQDFLMVSSFGFWAMMLGFVPVATIHFLTVQVGRDYGATIEILGGLTEGTVVVTNPNADLMDGMRVHVTAASDQENPAGARGAPPAPTPTDQKKGR